jgi:hypothetical protein
MKTFGYVVILLFVFSVGLNGCKKFLEIDSPAAQLVTSSVFNNNSAATSAQIAIYTQMANNGESANMSVNLGLLSDELTNYSTNTSFLYYYINAMTAFPTSGPWNNAYNYIYEANAILSEVQGNSSLNSSVSKQLIGESKFVRAFWLFYLTNLYGNVPVPISTNYAINSKLDRTSRAQVYQQIINDLEGAKSSLNPNFVDGTDTLVTTMDRGRPTKGAAQALLARVYLFNGDYVDAESEADSVIANSSLYSLCPDLNSVFLVNSPEAIWQLDIPQPSNINTQDGADFILLSAPPSSGCCSISPQLLSSFEPMDNRRINWVDSFQTSDVPAINYYYPNKYKIRSGSIVAEDVMVLRLAEQFLIRSESRANQNNFIGAIDDLNTIRSRANLPPYAGAMDEHSILNAILHERQVELFSEWGNRWLDLIRLNKIDSVMSVVCPEKGGSWSPDGHQQLFPVPRSEVTVDPNLTQNSGY